MLLPESLLIAMEDLASSVDRKQLQKSAAELSSRYRRGLSQKDPFIKTQEECLAYLYTRFPATFAANYAVFSELKERSLEPIESILDLGAGSGAAFWAAYSMCQNLDSYTLLERDQRLIDLGKKLLINTEFSLNPEWICSDYGQLSLTKSYDLTLFSYSLGETESKEWEAILKRVMAHTTKLFVMIEPGTPSGYHKIIKVRDFFIQHGFYTVAPCPHNKKCPLLGQDWCHFSQRLPRTSLHRILKSGSLGFEDEKFSYIIMSKAPYSLKGYRVIKTPLKRSGYIELELCSTEEGLVHKKTSKKHKEFFSEAKKLDWGSFYSE